MVYRYCWLLIMFHRSHLNQFKCVLNYIYFVKHLCSLEATLVLLVCISLLRLSCPMSWVVNWETTHKMRKKQQKNHHHNKMKSSVIFTFPVQFACSFPSCCGCCCRCFSCSRNFLIALKMPRKGHRKHFEICDASVCVWVGVCVCVWVWVWVWQHFK